MFCEFSNIWKEFGVVCTHAYGFVKIKWCLNDNFLTLLQYNENLLSSIFKLPAILYWHDDSNLFLTFAILLNFQLYVVNN